MTRALGLLVALWAAALIFAALAKATPALAPPNVKRAIDNAADRYRVSRSLLHRLSWCESRHNRFARNPEPVGTEHALGLMQFLPSTWATTPYRARYIFSAHYQALAAAWMISVGRLSEWACR